MGRRGNDKLLNAHGAKETEMSKSKSKKFRKKKKTQRSMSNKDKAIFEALRNPNQTTSIIDENGYKRWFKPYKFISTLHRSIKTHKKYLSAENAHDMITNYEMPAIQRCLQMVLMLNHNKDFNENDLHKYIARKFDHITLEMLDKDYQTEDTRAFKEDYDEFRRSQSSD